MSPRDLIAAAGKTVMPAWVKWVALAALLAAAYGQGRLDEARHGAAQRLAEAAKQASANTKLDHAQTRVVHDVEIRYVPKIEKVYLQGEKIEKVVPVYVTQSDDMRFGVNRGFVRILDAAWTGADPPVAAETDREPAGVPLSDIAANESDNATACLAWQQQALAVREAYERVRAEQLKAAGNR